MTHWFSRAWQGWVAGSVALTAAVVVVSVLLGMVGLPLAQPGSGLHGVWDAICSAAGVPRNAARGPVVPATFKTSDVVFTPVSSGFSASIGHGGTLAQRCAICHGIRGEGGGAVPGLAGQYAAALSKELSDFRSGARDNAVMGPFAQGLSAQDVQDLAAYYADVPGRSEIHAGAVPMPLVIVDGAPMRNVPPCSACHGSMGLKIGAPRLDGQSAVYLREQLDAFASGSRHNDISMQMRNVAHGMTVQEMDAAVAWYAAAPDR